MNRCACGARVPLDGASCGACIRGKSRRVRWRCSQCRVRGSSTTAPAASDALWAHDRAYHRTESA